MLESESPLSIDYAGDGKYVLLVKDAAKDWEAPKKEKRYYFDGVSDIMHFVHDRYGDIPVELSAVAHIVLTIELGVDSDTDFSVQIE